MPLELLNNTIEPYSEIILWKYLDLWKFESLLSKNAIFFCRVDKFPDDPYEGSTPLKVKAKRFQDIMGSELFYGNSNISKMNSQNEMISSFQKNVLRKQRIVNCWHISESECNLMWNSYLDNIKEGVVIKTNLKRLVKSFEKNPENIKYCRASYLDYNEEDWLNNYESFDLTAPFIHKKKGFLKENELRLLYEIPIYDGNELDAYWDQQSSNKGIGINLELDLDILIEEIYCSPQSEEIQIERINKSISDFGFTFDVLKSCISKNGKPIF